ncbi:hypothetical protein VHUM_02417 [Vanrija humicola]|uniref:Nucleoporin Nup54 alpha-helical domain-containing protein n=1 Tax=Vanrija humicola TaxID=5417 RepID=A0A7D8Z364_VANHU|nr:hypothetical protein VHUM_02417 [Vanrija humicola]
MAFSFGGAAAQPAQPQQSSLFGNTADTAGASTSTTGGAFGAAPAAAQPAGSGLFGSTSAAPASTGTGLFGAAKPATTGLFGQASTGTTGTTGTTGLFGQQQQAQPAATGGLFGQQQQQQPAQTGGLFGQQQQQPAATGGLFGQQQQQQPAAGGLFGQQKPAGGLFGSTSTAPATQPATGGLFGQQQQQQQPAAGGGLFGQASTTQPATGGLFGAKPAGSGLFGSTTQQPAQQGGLFGSTNQQPASGLFGSTAQPQAQQQQSVFNSTTAPLATSINQAPKEENIEQRIMSIASAWDETSPDCRFKYFFYNVVEPGQSQYYGRPAGATDDTKWARAVRDNPDPQNLVPVLATGFGDVKKRVQAQEQLAAVHQQKIKEINAALAELSRKASLDSSVRLATLQANLGQLSQRLMHLAAKSPSFAPVQSSAFRPEEAEMKTTLENVKDELDGRVKPAQRSGTIGLNQSRHQAASRGRMMGQVNELWGAIEELRRQRRARGAETVSWASDEKLLNEIALVLDQQQQALSKLSELASDAVFDADVIRQGVPELEQKK